MAKYKNTLNEVDRFWIDHNPTMSTDELSKKLQTTAATIKHYKASKPAVEHITTTKTSFIKKGGATVMTQAQSEKGDAVKARPGHMDSCVHTFNVKDEE
jgi:hypothetical protein